jgi:cell division transport system permease protein
VKYISKDAALTTFIENHQDDTTLMESLTEVGINPFLASLDIKSYNPGQYGQIVEILENSLFFNKIEKIDYYERQPVIERIFGLTSALNVVGIVLSVILAVLAVLVVFNTIRLSIYNFREEIKIQRLVGASNWFIRGPFLVQGVVSGFFAALICLGVFALACWGLNSSVLKIFSGLSVFQIFLSNIWWILLIQMAGGILLGVISSLFAVRRHLNV